MVRYSMTRNPILAGLLAFAALIAALPIGATAEAAQGLRILNHQAARIVGAADSNSELQFDAYGRRFELRLERNDRLHFMSPTRTPGVTALQGTVAGTRNSWVRITRTPAGLYGMIFDGNDLYAIEPALEAARSTVGPVEASGTAPVIYRLKDTIMPPGEASCGTDDRGDGITGSARTGLQVFQALAAELQPLAAAIPSKQIEIAMVGDFEMSTVNFGAGLTPESAIAARMNVVDGIFSSQVGVKLTVTDVTIFRSAADPFTDTLAANTLLTEFANFRRDTPSQNARGLSHLLTGRDLEGTTVGIAFLRALCSRNAGAGLSMANLSANNSALVIAHEMGHNFGASHDGEAGTACEATPQTFLMAPSINGSNQFSQCSLDSMTPIVAAASCVTALNVPDASLGAPVAGSRLRGQSFAYTLTVQSIGGVGIDNVNLSINIPASITVNSATVAGGAACTAGAGGALSCAIGTLAAGANRDVNLNLTGSQNGNVTLTATVSGTNDSVSANNSRQATFTFTPSADLAVTLSAAPASFTTGGSTQLTANLRHAGGDAVTDALLSFTLPVGLTVTAVGTNSLGCTLQGTAVSCSGTALANGASQSVVLTATAADVGARQVSAAVTATLGDPVSSNNSASVSIDTAAPAANNSGGGGGAFTLAQLFGLMLLAVARRRGPDARRHHGSSLPSYIQ